MAAPRRCGSQRKRLRHTGPELPAHLFVLGQGSETPPHRLAPSREHELARVGIGTEHEAEVLVEQLGDRGGEPRERRVERQRHLVGENLSRSPDDPAHETKPVLCRASPAISAPVEEDSPEPSDADEAPAESELTADPVDEQTEPSTEMEPEAEPVFAPEPQTAPSAAVPPIEETSSPAIAEGQVRILLTYTGDCWTEVTDAISGVLKNYNLEDLIARHHARCDHHVIKENPSSES